MLNEKEGRSGRSEDGDSKVDLDVQGASFVLFEIFNNVSVSGFDTIEEQEGGGILSTHESDSWL